MAKLADLVQALPQELYDKIYDLTFPTTVNTTSSVLHITKRYQPPSCLQVSRDTRNSYASSYYGGSTIFYIAKEDSWKWIASLPQSHFEMLREVRILNNTIVRSGAPASDDEIAQLIASKLDAIDKHAAQFGPDSNPFLWLPDKIQLVSQCARERISLKPQIFKFKAMQQGERTWKSV